MWKKNNTSINQINLALYWLDSLLLLKELQDISDSESDNNSSDVELEEMCSNEEEEVETIVEEVKEEIIEYKNQHDYEECNSLFEETTINQITPFDHEIQLLKNDLSSSITDLSLLPLNSETSSNLINKHEESVVPESKETILRDDVFLGLDDSDFWLVDESHKQSINEEYEIFENETLREKNKEKKNQKGQLVNTLFKRPDDLLSSEITHANILPFHQEQQQHHHHPKSGDMVMGLSTNLFKASQDLNSQGYNSFSELTPEVLDFFSSPVSPNFSRREHFSENNS